MPDFSGPSASIKDTLCSNYDVRSLSDKHFICSFVCKGPYCNLETVTNGFLTSADLPLPDSPATRPGSCSIIVRQ